MRTPRATVEGGVEPASAARYANSIAGIETWEIGTAARQAVFAEAIARALTSANVECPLDLKVGQILVPKRVQDGGHSRAWGIQAQNGTVIARLNLPAGKPFGVAGALAGAPKRSAILVPPNSGSVFIWT